MPFPRGFVQRRGPMVGLAEEPEADVVLPAINHRHERQDDVVQGGGEDGRQDVAPRQPGEAHRGQEPQTEDGGKAKKRPMGTPPAMASGVSRIANNFNECSWSQRRGFMSYPTAD